MDVWIGCVKFLLKNSDISLIEQAIFALKKSFVVTSFGSIYLISNKRNQ